jgi:hypothetical protein
LDEAHLSLPPAIRLSLNGSVTREQGWLRAKQIQVVRRLSQPDGPGSGVLRSNK